MTRTDFMLSSTTTSKSSSRRVSCNLKTKGTYVTRIENLLSQSKDDKNNLGEVYSFCYLLLLYTVCKIICCEKISHYC